MLLVATATQRMPPSARGRQPALLRASIGVLSPIALSATVVKKAAAREMPACHECGTGAKLFRATETRKRSRKVGTNLLHGIPVSRPLALGLTPAMRPHREGDGDRDGGEPEARSEGRTYPHPVPDGHAKQDAEHGSADDRCQRAKPCGDQPNEPGKDQPRPDPGAVRRAGRRREGREKGEAPSDAVGSITPAG
jgi:hypothetical protein